MAVRFGALQAGYAPTLDDAYRVSSQSPRIGAKIRVVHGRWIAPLVINATQRPLFLHLGRCTIPPRSAIEGEDAEAVVYSTPMNIYTSIWSGCLLSTGRTRQLGSSSTYAPYEFESLALSALSGHYAALLMSNEDKAEFDQSLAVADLSTGERTTVGPRCGQSQCIVGQVVINSSGFVAWHQWQTVNYFPLTGVACPSVSLCVATDGYGSVLVSTDPTGGPSSWTSTPLEEGTFIGVSCADERLCVAVDDQGDAFVSTDPTGGPTTWTKSILQRDDALSAVSCTSGLCAVVDRQGQVFISADPTAGASSWTVADIDAGHALSSVSCPSSGLCIAADGGAGLLTSTAPTGGAAAWTSAPMTGIPASDNSLSLSTLSCFSTSFCVAAGLQLPPVADGPLLAGGRAAASTNPTGGTSAWTTSRVPTPLTRPAAVSCPSSTLCVIADAFNVAYVSTNPNSAQASWSQEWLGGNGSNSGLSCPATDLCVASNEEGQISTTTDPLAGSGWTANIIDRPSCGFSTGFCNVEQIYGHDSHGTRLLDHAVTAPVREGTALTNLELSDNTLTWTHNGTQQSASLG